MATLSHPAVMSHVTEILEVAHSILRRTGNHDLVQKIMILEGYLDLRQMNPDRTYDDIIQKALDDLTALVHLLLEGETAEINRQSVRSVSRLALPQDI